MIDQLHETLSAENRAGVSCLHCGNYTPLPKETAGRAIGHKISSSIRLFIIRCHVCGREGSYLGHDVVEFRGLAKAAKLVA
jgi:hypothetical protein